jgi:two-component system cell cycle sensor histidine kinase/response regulator CckA
MGKSILLVDDEQLMTSIISKLLKRKGYTTYCFNDSMEALISFQCTPDKFDLVITDMNMPGMNGKVLTDEILKVRSEMKVITLTGFDNISNPGAAMTVLKPISSEELDRVIQIVLNMD